jgi:hypothetical protein
VNDDIVLIRLSRTQASFLQANLSLLASSTRQAMARPGINMERRQALVSRAAVLERIEDTVQSAMLDGPEKGRRGNRGIEAPPRTPMHEFRRLSAA